MVRPLPPPGPRPAAAPAAAASKREPQPARPVPVTPRPSGLDVFVERPSGELNVCAPPPPAPSPPPVLGPRAAPPGPPVVVVMDGALDDRHQALAGSMWTNAAEVAGDGVDNDGNGVVDDVHGFNVGLGGGDLAAGKSLEHGTHVAGIALGKDGGAAARGATAGQALVMGVSGMYDGCDMLTNFERAVDYVVMMKARGANVRVANASFGGSYPKEADQARWKAAAQKLAAADILFCVATDNGSGSNLNGKPDMPGNLGLPNQVTVTATDKANDKLATFASFGDQVVHIAAVGENVSSAAPGGGTRVMSGTSMATPAVAGAAAAAFALNPALTAAQVRDLILQTAQQDADLEGKVSTGGKLDVPSLLEAVRRTLPSAAPSPEEAGETGRGWGELGDWGDWGWDWFDQLAA